MAQIIECDGHNREHPADWIVSRLDGTVNQAYCDDAYRELMVSTVDAMNQAEADQTDAEAIARIEAAGPAPATVTTEQYDGQGELVERREVDVPAAVEPARTVRRGQSARARAHRERVAARAEKAAAATVSSGPDDDDEDDDEDGATAGDAPPA